MMGEVESDPSSPRSVARSAAEKEPSWSLSERPKKKDQRLEINI